MKRRLIQPVVRWALCLPLLLGFGCASFELTSEPQATIYEHEEEIGVTPYHFTLLSGMRHFTLKIPGYVEESVPVSSLDPKELHFQMERVGRTQIDTFPGGAIIVRSSDHVKRGVTPCNLRLSVPETVLIRLDGFETVELDLIPNQRYELELDPTGGFQSAFYKNVAFTSDLGPVEIHDRLAGEKIGVTPIQLRVEVGRELEYRLAGYKPRITLISKRAPLLIHIELEALTVVTLSAEPGTEVYRAGGIERIGEVPFTIEIDSSTTFELKKEGYYDSTIAVGPGSPKKLAVELKKIPYKTIVTEPAGAEIYRLGGIEKLGVSPYTTVVDSERVFEIKKTGFKSKVIGMGSSSPSQLRVPLSAAARDDPDAAALGTLDSSVISTY